MTAFIWAKYISNAALLRMICWQNDKLCVYMERYNMFMIHLFINFQYMYLVETFGWLLKERHECWMAISQMFVVGWARILIKFLL